MNRTDDKVINDIKKLFVDNNKEPIMNIEMLLQSGSDRIYYRIFTNESSFIATYNININENNTFLYFSKHFKLANLSVPQILYVNDEHSIYIQEDKGKENLLDKIGQLGKDAEVYSLYQKSLSQLAAMQILGDKGLDYNQCFAAKSFGKQAILNDLLYFKYYFLDTLYIPYNKQLLQDEMETLSTFLAETERQYFMFRDFQSRNILVKGEDVSFIDYQGGMKGALQYDVASLLWQAKANLSEEWKDSLLEYYMNEVEKLLDTPLDKTAFVNQYNGYVLIRLLQVLGAYGFRGLFERKEHFISSIPLALKNIQFFVANKQIGLNLPLLYDLLLQVSSEEIISRFTTIQANESTPLVVEINSFSYRNGIPGCENESGGGYVFDMRGILNPGRFDDYKKLSGLDKPVQDFLKERTKMPDFLQSVWEVIDISVENYLERGFEHLSINFGCTGGQHRSVFAAEQTAKHLKEKYKVKIELKHTNTAKWVR